MRSVTVKITRANLRELMVAFAKNPSANEVAAVFELEEERKLSDFEWNEVGWAGDPENPTGAKKNPNLPCPNMERCQCPSGNCALRESAHGFHIGAGPRGGYNKFCDCYMCSSVTEEKNDALKFFRETGL